MRVLNTPFIDKRIFLLLRFFLACIFFCSFSNNSYSQAPSMLELTGRTIKDGKPLPGAIVTVFKNGTIQQEQIKTGKNGKFRFFLIFGSDYKVTFSYPGCVDMYLMVYTGKFSKDKLNLFPLYEADVPFFETSTNEVRIEKFKQPFTKIIFDGNKAFKDDDAYLADFTKDIVIDPAEQAKLFAAKEAKEKAEKEKLELAEKTKKDAEEKAKKDASEKLLAEQKAKDDALAKADELARLKEESEKQKLLENETMESEAIRLQREKEAKGILTKKNKDIKTGFENDLLKAVAENERLAKEKTFNKQRSEARSKTVIEQMRKETEVKALTEKLREEVKLKQKKTLENQQYKSTEVRKLVEAAAFAERSVRISNQKKLPDVNGYKSIEIPNLSVTVSEGIIKTIRTTVVTQGKKLDSFRKEIYFWGSTYYYKNNIEIDEASYNKEVSFYSGYQNK